MTIVSEVSYEEAVAATTSPIEFSLDQIRTQIQSSSDLSTELVEVPEWGVTIGMKTMSGKARARLLKDSSDEDGTVNFERMYADLLVNSCVHPTEPDTYLFTPADREWLNDKSGAVLERLAQIGMRLSGLDKDAEKRLGEASAGELETPEVKD